MWQVLQQIRPEERRASTAAFACLFGILAGHTLLETARDALFLARLPPARLAWVYLLIALVSLGIFWVQQRLAGSRTDRAALGAWLVAAAVVDVGFWFGLGRAGTLGLYALYTWSGIVSTLVVLRFWTLLGELFTVGQAKRLYPFVGAGSVFGAIAGAALARLFSGAMASNHLLLASAGVHLATALGPVLLLPRPPAGAPRDASRAGLRASLHTVWERPYLRRVAAIVLVSTVTLTLVDFLFKNAVARSVAPAGLGAFFATTYLILNVLSLVVQMLLVSRLLRTQGVHRALSLLPLLLLVGAGGVILGGGLVAALLLKSADGALRHSLHRTATEVLFVPLGSDTRARVKGVIDVVGLRGGQALASLGILTAAALGPVEWLLAAATAGLAVVWIRVATTLRRHYLDLFRDTLSDVAVQTRFDFPELDLASLEALMAALNSAEDREVLAALDLLVEQGRERLLPALILYHPSPAVVVRALEIFTRAGREDFSPISGRLLEHPDAEVRAATLRARAWMAPDPEVCARFTTDPSPIVRATALVGLVSYGGVAAADARRVLEELARQGTAAERFAVARAVRTSPGAGFESMLLELAGSGELRVRGEVARAMREILSARFVPALVQMLPEQELRSEARATLVAIGPDALRALDRALADPALGSRVRRQLPRALGQFRSPEVVGILMRHMREERDGAVRYRILRSIERLRLEDPNVRLEATVLHEALERALRSIFQLVNWRLQIEEGTREDAARQTPVQDLVRGLLANKEDQALERAFRILGLLHPGEDLRRIYRGLRSPHRKLQASSLELLENLLRPPWRDPVLAAVEDIPPGGKLERAGSYFERTAGDYESLLRDLLRRGGTGTRCLVAYHVGELRLHRLRPALLELPEDAAHLIPQSVELALDMLGQDTGERVRDGS